MTPPLLPIRTRDDLAEVAMKYAPTSACERAIREGRFTILGGFITPKTLPCWIMRVVCKHGQTWNIRVSCCEKRRTYQIDFPKCIPWANWIGTRGGKRPLIDGDDPKRGAFERMRAIHGRKTETTSQTCQDVRCL